MPEKPIIALRVNPQLKEYILQISNETGKTMSSVIKEALLKQYSITYKPEEYTFK